jgi:alkylhydroperoxidase family enzyme
VAKNTAGGDDAAFAEVRRHFNDAELVELTGVCGLFAQSNRFQDSLKLPIEPPHEVDKIRSSIRVDPARLKAYVERLVETWPERFPLPAVRFAPGTPEFRSPAQRGAPRIPLIDPGTASPDAALFLRQARELLGALPSYVRLWAHVPHLGKLFLPLPVALTRDGAGAALPVDIRAIFLLATSQANAAPYSLAHHAAMARATGLTAKQVGSLESGTSVDSPDFGQREHAVIAWAGHVARNSAKNHDEAFAALQAHFSDAEIVEMTALGAVACKMDRIHNALRLPLEPEAELAALQRSARIDPARLRAYLQAVVDAWPERMPAPAD